MSDTHTQLQAAQIKVVGVLGAGQMGAGIAHVAALSGFEVRLADVDRARAQAGKAGIASRLSRDVEKGKISAEAVTEALARLTPATLQKLREDLNDMGVGNLF